MDKVKAHLQQWWWAYLLALTLLYVLARQQGWLDKFFKKPSEADKNNSTILGVDLFPELDYNKPICVGESGEYVKALFRTQAATSVIIASPVGAPDRNIYTSQTNNFNDPLNNWLDYMVNGAGSGNSKTSGVTYQGCINLSDALKLAKSIKTF